VKLLRFRKLADDSIRIVVHLDETKLGPDGQPDPAWIYMAQWPPKPAGVTVAAYIDMVKREAKLVAQLRLAELRADTEGTLLTGEGETL
jgi:hypothetical protein